MRRTLIITLALLFTLPAQANIENDTNLFTSQDPEGSISKGIKEYIISFMQDRAKEGDNYAQAFLSASYLDYKDYKSAYEWALKSAKQRDSYAQFFVGYCLYNG